VRRHFAPELEDELLEGRRLVEDSGRTAKAEAERLLPSLRALAQSGSRRRNIHAAAAEKVAVYPNSAAPLAMTVASC
jgi:hypothetical protein